MSRKRRPTRDDETELVILGPSPDGDKLETIEISAPVYAALKRAGLDPFAMDFPRLVRLCALDGLIDLEGDTYIRVQPRQDYDDIAEFDFDMLALGFVRYIRRYHSSDRPRPGEGVFTLDGKPAADAEKPRSHVIVRLVPPHRRRRMFVNLFPRQSS
jgi:hypothetical protein